MKNPSPLEGLKVLDLSRLIPGPFCSLILSDLGAKVTKVEDPEFGDSLRSFPPMKEAEQSILHFVFNRGKKIRQLSLTQAKDRQKLEKLIRESDVLIESFRPGVLSKMGWSSKVLFDLNPQLVIASITGYGQSGPAKNLAGHDSNFLGYAGLIQNQSLPHVQWADLVGGGLSAALNIMAALWQKQKKGKGSHIDISITDTMIFFNMGPVVLGQLGLSSNLITGALARYKLYKTKDERLLVVAPLENKFWNQWCETIGKPEWKSLPGHYPDLSGDIHHEMERIISKKTIGEWSSVLKNHDLCITPALTSAEVSSSDLFLERKFYSTHNIDGRDIKVPKYPWN